MRDNFFRGKTSEDYDDYLDCGDWIEGFYVCLNDKEHRIYTGYAETDCGDYYPDWFNVVPKTVGRCTEMEDENGVEIFEGDIVYRDWFGGRTYQVVYDDRIGAFIGKAADKSFTTFDGDSDLFKVIGNIHDNPELMNN